MIAKTCIRVGITQRVEAHMSVDERRDSLDQEWTRLVCQLGHLPIPLGNGLSDLEFFITEMELSAILLTGGNDTADQIGAENVTPERDKAEKVILGVCEQLRMPVLGVCRGFQMINSYLGGHSIPVSGHVRNNHQINDASGQIAFSEVNSFHNFGITMETLAPGLDPRYFSKDGTVEGALSKTLPWMGIMWHPERTIADRKLHLDIVNHALLGTFE
ncbi:gamma-glutamyl-gamma-aminobutyrate hydrolase family protein [Alphaproteobacteria bacterium]|nr:gamma-glutamyl-gamma-aminobutyrate hydrolase family protein [Alphaproteobacteria bacterium]